MHAVKNGLIAILFIAVTLFSSKVSAESTTKGEAPTDYSIFIGAIINDYEGVLPQFLRTLENLDYNKKHIAIQLSRFNDGEASQKLLSDWIVKNRDYYHSLTLVDHSSLYKKQNDENEKSYAEGVIKDGYLALSREGNYTHCLILSSSHLIAPHTLKLLLEKEKPIIAPLLRPVPEAQDLYRNFFADVTENGFYRHHQDYCPIANRESLGTFKMPCVHGVYLIQMAQSAPLSFTRNFAGWDFITFSNHARNHNIDQYLSNEREFGFLIHLKDCSDKETRRQFSLIKSDLEVNRDLINSLLAPYYPEDPTLKNYVDYFDYGQYAIYRVENRDLYYVDEVNDYIKNYVIKRGSHWETELQELFKRYTKPDTLALDIGSHIGTHTLFFSKTVGDQGHVYAFEPQAKMFTELSINMHLNDCKNVTCYHNALGAEEKWIEMHIPKEDWTDQFGPTLVNEGHGTVSDSVGTGDLAKVIRLDDLNLDNISFMKIDVEGYEMEVIKGGKKTILRNKPVMVIEIFDGALRNERLEAIAALGYTYENLGMDNFLFLPKKASQINVSPVKVVWEGTFLDSGSISYVNRSFTHHLLKNPEMSLSHVRNLQCEFALSECSNLNLVADLLKETAPADTQVTVRHRWPPDWEAPIGKWVLIQPWEFGALPKEWVSNISRVDEIWTPTQFVKRGYIESGVPSDKIFVVPNGIDPEKFHPSVQPYPLKTNKKYKFLFVGGTIWRKGADILLETYLKTFTDKDDVTLVIKDVGSKSFYAELTHRDLIKKAQAQAGAPEIIYIEDEMSQDEVAGVYAACDCLVYPYRGEGFALPVLEAMAVGLPVIVTEGGATDDFVKKEYGWFIPSKIVTYGDMVGGMKLVANYRLREPDTKVFSQQMRYVSDHPEEGKLKGNQASLHVRKEWTWERAAWKAAERLKELASG